MKCEQCGTEIDKADRLSFWWMFDNHTFSKLDGTLDMIPSLASECEDMDHWGMLCPVIVLSGEKELRRVGPCVHGRGSKSQSSFLEGVKEWKTAILADEDVFRLIPK